MNKFKKRFGAILFWLSFVCAVNTQSETQEKSLRKPLVVTSIKPLEYIVADIAGDLVELRSVLSASGSPHHYALKSSQVRMISESDLLVWVDPKFEHFLAKLANRKDASRVFQLSSAMKLAHAPLKSQEHAEDHIDTGHHHQHYDLHVWLDPNAVATIVKPLTQKLLLLLPHHGDELVRNERLFLERLSRGNAKIKDNLSENFKGKRGGQNGFMVFHDAYRRFEGAYGLAHLSSVTEVPDEQIGAKTLARLKREAAQSQCLIADVSEYAAAQKIAKRVGVRTVRVDALSSEPVAVSAGTSQYVEYLSRFSSQFFECFEI